MKTQTPNGTASLSKIQPFCTRTGCLFACIVTFFALGCSNDTDDSENQLGIKDAGESDAQSEGVACTKCPEVGAWYAYEHLTLTSLAGDENQGSIATLNAMWANAFASKELNVLYQVTESDEEHLYFVGYNGVSDGQGGYCLKRESELPVHLLREGCHLKMEEATRFNVFTGSVDVVQNCAPNLSPMHAIPVDNAWFELGLTEDCSALIDGKVLSATIPIRALDGVCVCPAISNVAERCGGVDPDYIATSSMTCDGCGPLYYRLRSLMDITNPDGIPADCDGENGEKGVCMTATFSAKRLNESPKFCDE